LTGGFDFIVGPTSQNSVLAKLIATSFAPREGIKLFVCCISLDSLDLASDFVLDIRPVFLLGSLLVQFHFVNELLSQGSI
jgi:hypothetical protein